MRTLTIPLNAASPRARLVLADLSAGVGLWLSEPDTRLVRDQHVHTGSVGRQHAAELGEFLLACPAPDYEPEPGQDQATWLAHFVAGGPRPHIDLDLRLNRGRTDARPGGPQGLLRSLDPADSPCCSRPATSPSSGQTRARPSTPPEPGPTSGTSTASAAG